MHLPWTALIYHPNTQIETIRDCTTPPQTPFRLSPKQNSNLGKDPLSSITKQSDLYLRSLFTTGALAVIRAWQGGRRRSARSLSGWLQALRSAIEAARAR
jgi:transposase